MRLAKKQFLTVREFAKEIDRCYGTIRNWILAGRILATRKPTPKGWQYRVSVKEAARVKRLLESGMFV